MATPFSYLSIISTGSAPAGGEGFAYVQLLNTSNPFGAAPGSITGDYMGTGERGNYFYTSNNTFAPLAHSHSQYLTTAALSNHSHTQYLTTAQPPGAYLTTAAVSDHSHGALALTNLSGTSASNGLSLSVPPGGAVTVSLDQVADPSGDKVFNMGLNALQFQYAGGGTFSTNATRQALFEIDVVGNLTGGADVVHVHQSVGAPQVDLLHLQAAGTDVTLLRLDAAASIAAEINKPLLFTGGSVPMVLGTSQSNSVANLNANYVQGQGSSYFANSTHTHSQYLTTAQPPGAYLTTAAEVSHTHGSGPSITGSIGVTSNSSAWSISIPAFLTTAAATNVTTNNMATAERANYFYTSNNTFANSTHTHGGLTINATNLTTGVTSASNGLTINLQAAAPGAAQANPQYWACPPWQAGGGGNLITNLSATAMTRRPFFLPFYVTGNLTAEEIHWGMSRAATGNNSFTLNIGIYSYSASSKLNLIASTQNVYVQTDTASQSGLRGFEANLGTDLSTLSPGQYVLAMAFSANGDSTSAFNYSLLGGSTSNTLNQTWVVSGSNAYHNYTSHHLMLFYGRYTATSAVIPATVGLADVVAYQASQVPLFFTLGNHV